MLKFLPLSPSHAPSNPGNNDSAVMPMDRSSHMTTSPGAPHNAVFVVWGLIGSGERNLVTHTCDNQPLPHFSAPPQSNLTGSVSRARRRVPYTTRFSLCGEPS